MTSLQLLPHLINMCWRNKEHMHLCSSFVGLSIWALLLISMLCFKCLPNNAFSGLIASYFQRFCIDSRKCPWLLWAEAGPPKCSLCTVERIPTQGLHSKTESLRREGTCIHASVSTTTYMSKHEGCLQQIQRGIYVIMYLVQMAHAWKWWFMPAEWIWRDIWGCEGTNSASKHMMIWL